MGLFVRFIAMGIQVVGLLVDGHFGRLVREELLLLFRARFRVGHVVEFDPVYVVEHDRRAVVGFLCDQLHVVHRDVLRVADVEAPGRQFAELREFGIAFPRFGNAVQLGGSQKNGFPPPG